MEIDARSIPLYKTGIDDQSKCDATTLVAFATLAPSTHNTQPWLFRVRRNQVSIYANPAKKLPIGDPQDRYLFVSLGCALENLVIAAKYFGVFKNVTYGTESGPGAIVQLGDWATANINQDWQRLMLAMQKRVNVRGTYKDQEVEEGLLNRIAQLNEDDKLWLDVITDKHAIGRLASLTALGVKESQNNPAFRKEVSGWVTSSLSKKDEGIPAKSTGVPGPIAWALPFLVKNLNLGSLMAGDAKKAIMSAPFVCLASAKEDTKEALMKLGRLSQRTILELTAQNLHTSIYVGALENKTLRAEARKLSATSFSPTLLFCGGHYTKKVEPSPRVDYQKKIVR